MTLQFNNVMLEQTLAAVPLFVFMGIMMEQAGLMERLFNAVQLMLSKTNGALYIAVLFVSTIFAAATRHCRSFSHNTGYYGRKNNESIRL